MQAQKQPRQKTLGSVMRAHCAIGAVAVLAAMIATPPAQAQTPELDWAVQAGGTGAFTRGQKVAVDGSGNIYVSGSFTGTTVFGAGDPKETTLTSSGMAGDMFVASYDSAGALRWVKRSSGTDAVQAFGIAADASGNVWVTGLFDFTATFAVGDANEITLTSFGVNDIFIAKYDSAGNLLWVKQAGGTEEEAGFDIAVDASGHSWVTGYFQGTATFGMGGANKTTLTGTTGNVFVARYDAAGALVWAKMASGGDGASGEGIAIDAAGNSYVTGYVLAGGTFGPNEPNQTTVTGSGDDDIFVARFDNTGALVWVKVGGGTGRDIGTDIAIDQSGNSWITGYFQDTATFGSGEAGQTALVSASGWDIVVARYDSAGSLVWAKRAGGAGTEEQGGAIALDASGQSYVIGSFQSPAIFGPGEANETILTTDQPIDAFFAQYDAAGQLVSAARLAEGMTFGTGIARDAMGKLYVTGGFLGTATFGVGAANETTLTGAGDVDFFLLRYGTGSSGPEVSFDSLANLVSEFVTQPLVKKVLLGEVQLAKSLYEHGYINSMNYVLRVFVYGVSQQTGRSLTEEQATTLMQIANALMQ